jgi:negative regulator of sigma-B (phosphoserine phosphatase)
LRIDAAHLTRPVPGEVKNGDAALVRKAIDDSEVLLAVIDGLGHGPDAAHASQLARDLLNGQPYGTKVEPALQEVHRQLRGTRGAAATVCLIKGTELQACAVGNVALLTVNCTVPLVLSAGVLGHQVARFRISNSQLHAGARLALLSDGISTRFRLDDLRALSPAQACQEIMQRYRRKDDDATVLVADILDA